MTRTGYTATGMWATETHSVSESKNNITGADLATAFGKDISSGNATVYVYAQWDVNELTVNYYSNYATSAFSGALNTVSASRRVW